MDTSKRYKNILTEEFLLREYVNNRKTTTLIAEELGCQRNTVSSYLKKLGIKTKNGYRPAFVNENFFETPNLINCYYAGFIAADGCVQLIKSRQTRLRIYIHEKDTHLLESLKFLMNYEGSIKRRFRETKWKDGNVSSGWFVILDIGSDKICDDLNNNFSITPNKSLTLQPPCNLSNKLALSFIIGLIDGDGCIFREINTNRLGMCLIGTKEMMEWVKKILNDISNNGSNVYQPTGKKTFNYAIKGNAAENILGVLKNIDVPKMDRKWSKV